MTKYLVPVSYEMYGHITVEASSPEEAIRTVKLLNIKENIECTCIDIDIALGEDPASVETDDEDES